MNKVILIGRLARDPDMRTTGSGMTVTRFTVAVSRDFSSRNNNGQQQTDFVGCVAFGRQAENIAKYCSKGTQVAVDGRIQTGSYDAQDGQKRYTTDVVADNVTFLGSKGGNSSSEYSQPMPDYSEPQVETTDVSEDPFKDFGDEISLSDDDLPF